MKLVEYDFEIIHWPGISHGHADVMSRLPARERESVMAILDEARAPKKVVAEEQMLKEQRGDPSLLLLINYLEQEVLPDDAEHARRIVAESSTMMIDDRGVLMRALPSTSGRPGIIQTVIPEALREQIMQDVHEGPLGAHLGFRRIYDQLLQACWWKGMYAQLKEWIRACPKCQQHGESWKHGAPLQSILVEHPFERVVMDIIGPLPKTGEGNRYLLVFVEYLSKWAEAVPLREITAETVALAYLETIVCRFGAPECVLTDMGSQFTLELFWAVNEWLVTRHQMMTPYHPQTDGLVERLNGTLKRMLGKQVGARQ